MMRATPDSERQYLVYYEDQGEGASGWVVEGPDVDREPLDAEDPTEEGEAEAIAEVCRVYGVTECAVRAPGPGELGSIHPRLPRGASRLSY